jgi:hypothetical protein
MSKAAKMDPVAVAAPIGVPTAQGQDIPLAVSRVDVGLARFYIGYSVTLSIICSAWTLSNYRDGSSGQHIFALLATSVSVALLLGLLAEVLVYMFNPQTSTCYALMEQGRVRGAGISIVHVATGTIGVLSCCVAAVNVHAGAADALFVLSVCVIVLNWSYWIFCTPNVAMPLAVFSVSSEAQQRLLVYQMGTASYLLRHPTIVPR